MRPREQRNQRRDAAAKTEDGVPPHPRLTLKDEIFERPAKVANDPEADANRKGVPEQSMAAGPPGPPPQNDRADGDRRQKEPHVAKDREREGVLPQQPPHSRVRQHVDKADRQIHLVWHREER